MRTIYLITVHNYVYTTIAVIAAATLCFSVDTKTIDNLGELFNATGTCFTNNLEAAYMSRCNS